MRYGAAQHRAVRDMAGRGEARRSPSFLSWQVLDIKKPQKMRFLFFFFCLYLNYSSGEIKPAAIASAFTVAN